MPVDRRFRQVPGFFVENLRRINLALEIDDTFKPSDNGACLSSCSRAAVRACDRRLGSARIGHEVHADWLSRLWNHVGQAAQLQCELRSGIRNVLQVRRHARTPEYGHRRMGAVKSVNRTEYCSRWDRLPHQS